MHFDRIRLSGFKSFVDPTELRIEDGLTGVVGPNGCGKSNLLEAIRWVMGENSAKSLRGSGMDDVIFSGTDRRPARNLAEVTLMLDNSDRKAPAAFNGTDELEVSRRIERESGSAYRINGNDVRAKDVQLLFADAATGAHSPALVSQGRVGEMINAKPQNRRAVLEEAAGITGLHTRRKEAESRLRAAENNLLRLHDVMVQMDAQASSLKKQARQAARYKSISGDLRQAEASLLYIRWKSACEAVIESERQLREAEKQVADATAAVTRLNTDHAQASEQLPKLRQAEAEAAAKVQRLSVARDGLLAEISRIELERTELKERITQAASDQQRESEMLDDAKRAIATLGAEKDALLKEKEGASQAEAEAAAALTKAHEITQEAEARYDTLSSEVAAARANRDNLTNELEMLNRRIERINEDTANVDREIKELEEGDTQLKAVSDAVAHLEATEAELRDLQNLITDKETERLSIQENRDNARATLNEKNANVAGTLAEINALKELIKSHQTGDKEPVSTSLKVEAGYETALGSAFGDDLDAPANAEDQPISWRNFGALNPAPLLPDGAQAMTTFVSGEKALERRLSQIGIVESDAIGDAICDQLLPGQVIVTKEGALWRWDGFVRKADVKSAAAIRLAQMNRLEVLEGELAEKQALVNNAEDILIAAENAVDAALEVERATRKQRGEIENKIQLARQNLNSAEREGSERAKKLAALSERRSRLKDDKIETDERLEKANERKATVSSISDQEDTLSTLREDVEALRAQLSEKRANYDGLHRVQTERTYKLEKIDVDVEAWQRRLERANQHLSDVAMRTKELEQKLADLLERPEEIEQRKKGLIAELDKAETERQFAADQLAICESAVNEKNSDLKSAQEFMANIREGRVRYQAAHENAIERREAAAAQIGERFECPPARVLDVAEVKDQDNLSDVAEIERRLDRFKAERERLGAVNLRADVELEEILEQIAHLEQEKTDLEAAIARLRQAIGSLNREGRERLLAAFEQVNNHFGDLFQTLFGGGHAHLELIESDDPLEAGLEIMASPPGKKLQSLSLLSGGEQALTALSLIFAVFMTNPAPICVLDEVDAPLDDANVERFCNLLDNMIERTNTRFLIVTHNAVTMARMNRLFGVTMSERGVSQLVSVDLQMAEKFQAAS